jgi:very-short-patch-repair endonuclease
MDIEGDAEDTPDELSAARRAQLIVQAAGQGNVLSRRQLYRGGFTRGQVRAQIRARRWRRLGTQSVALHTGPLTVDGSLWSAVFEAGPRGFLDGASALLAAGLANFDPPRIRVSVPRGARAYRRTPSLDIRQTRRWAVDDVVGTGLPRARVEVAAVRAALWAASDRQATLIVTMVVQQGLTTPQRLGVEMLRIRRDRRRAMLHELILDLLDGARSLGELDFARLCRERGLPVPTRQSVRRGRNGRYYLDVEWAQWGVVVEIDGIHHSWATHVVEDALRHNDVAIAGALVLHLPLLGLRVASDAFFEQIEAALNSRGCPIVRQASA